MLLALKKKELFGNQLKIEEFSFILNENSTMQKKKKNNAPGNL